MLTIKHLKEVCLTSEDFNYVTSLYGEFTLDPDQKIVEEIKSEALKKYERMHTESTSVRFDKSWTGFIGELLSIEIFKLYGVKILQKPKINIPEKGYDEGDIWVYNKNKNSKVVINVSSRKLSKSDEIKKLFMEPENYIILIPVEQLNQYINKSHYSIYIYLIPKEHKIISDLNVITSGDFALPGFLKNSDIENLRLNQFAKIFKKGMSFYGLYENMSYKVQMYTDNLAIPLKLLRPICLFISELS